jgi:lysozyme
MSRRRRTNNYIGIIFVLVVMAALWFATGHWPFGKGGSDKETEFSMYPGFGIELPEDYAIHGIDVSRYQKSINWPLLQKMKSRDVKIKFAFMKATEGGNFTDKQFARNWRKSREAGVVRGAYHFFRANTDAAAQARHFIEKVTLLPGDLPPVLDVESLHNTPVNEMQDGVALWLLLIEQHYKVKPIIYTNATFYNNYLHPRFADFPLWVAHYKERKSPRVQRDWLFWQHSESGRVNGINHFVDFNVFNGDSTSFSELLVGE